MKITPTRRQDWVKPGDTCVVIFAIKSPMEGVVIRVDHKQMVPQATVKWSSGSTGTHTISTLRKVSK